MSEFRCLATVEKFGSFHIHEKCPAARTIDELLTDMPIATAIGKYSKQLCFDCVNWAKANEVADTKSRQPPEYKLDDVTDVFSQAIPMPVTLHRRDPELLEEVCVTCSNPDIFHRVERFCKLRRSASVPVTARMSIGMAMERLLPCTYCQPGLKPSRAKLSTPDILFVFNAPIPFEGVIIYLLDTEVVGATDETKRIKQISLIQLTNNKREAPRCYVKFFKLEEPGYSKSQAKNGSRTFKEELPAIKNFLNQMSKRVCLLAHNSSFDERQLDREFKLAGELIPDHWFFGDTLNVSRKLQMNPSNQRHTLGSMAEFWDRSVQKATDVKDSFIKLPGSDDPVLSIHRWTPVMRALRRNCDMEILNSGVSFHIADPDSLILRELVIFWAIWFGACHEAHEIKTTDWVVDFIAKKWKDAGLKAEQCHSSANSPDYDHMVWAIIQRIDGWKPASDIKPMPRYSPLGGRFICFLIALFICLLMMVFKVADII